uniref:Uncharacterized protein n=1 Tax=viral metagenome TaxID=1070528 RepID=A0A6M3L2M4_9ZZZZ
METCRNPIVFLVPIKVHRHMGTKESAQQALRVGLEHLCQMNIGRFEVDWEGTAEKRKGVEVSSGNIDRLDLCEVLDFLERQNCRDDEHRYSGILEAVEHIRSKFGLTPVKTEVKDDDPPPRKFQYGDWKIEQQPVSPFALDEWQWCLWRHLTTGDYRKGLRGKIVEFYHIGTAESAMERCDRIDQEDL